MSDWNDISSAPMDGTVVRLKLEDGVELCASYEMGFINEDGDDCGSWCAVNDDFPDDWSDGVCWTSNSDGVCSTWPVAWKSARD